MTNSSERTPRLRAAVGRAIGELLDAQHVGQDAFAKAINEAGLGEWDQTTISRFLTGARALTLEEAVVLAAALATPLDRLVPGDGTVLIGGQEVSAAQVRDVIQRGRIQADHAGHTALDRINSPEAATSADEVARQFGVTIQYLNDVSADRWGFYFNEQLERLVNESYERFTGESPLRPKRGIAAALEAVNGGGIEVSAERVRGWRGMHIRRMTRELQASGVLPQPAQQDSGSIDGPAHRFEGLIDGQPPIVDTQSTKELGS